MNKIVIGLIVFVLVLPIVFFGAFARDSSYSKQTSLTCAVIEGDNPYTLTFRPPTGHGLETECVYPYVNNSLRYL